MLATSGSPTRLTPLADAFAAIDAVAPSQVTEVAVAEAVGLTLAEDVVAPRALPAQPAALFDGYAVRAEATLDASAHAPVALDGKRVAAGDALPGGTDAVASLDHVQASGTRIEAIMAVAPGEGVRAAGGDCAQGAVLLRRGEWLRRSDVGVLALAGISKIKIRKPQFIVATDAEKSVQLSLTGLPSDIREAAFFDTVDRIAFSGVGLAPGERTALGFKGDMCVLLLPKPIDEALAAWRVLGTRLMARLSGSVLVDETVTAALSRKVTSTVGIADFIPLHIEGGKAEPLASKHLPLSALARANCYLLVPPQSEGYPSGAAVQVHSWR